MREKLARFMIGRNGADQLARFYSILALICIVASMIVGRASEAGAVSTLLWFAALALIVLSYFRMMSRKLEKRRTENARFMDATAKYRQSFKAAKDRFAQRKTFCFFRCPSCRTMLRVPRGKGKIRVICRKCGNSFERRT